MPVYRDSLDNILGIVFVKDMVALPPDAAPPLTTLDAIGVLCAGKQTRVRAVEGDAAAPAPDGDCR
jgi:CBS domain containing-hemolysin-like protein